MAARFICEERFNEIKQRLNEGDPLITEAHRLLIEKADAALDMQPLHIRMNGGSPYFREDGVYVEGKDGVRNPQSNTQSRELAAQFSAASRNLALAYRITGETRYADKALQLIHCWCINQDTRMFATGFVQDAATPGAVYGGDICLFGTFVPAFIAMYLLTDYPGWNINCHAAVRQWVRDMVEPQRKLMFFQGREMYNNWEDARLMYLAYGGLFLHDLDLLIDVFNRWKTIIPIKMTDEGELPRETMRTRSMNYTLFALSSTTIVAELADGFGCDLYNYNFNGRGLKLAIDYAAKYLLNMDDWPFEMIEPLENEKEKIRLDIFEMAYAQWGDQRYLDIINAWGGQPVAVNHATLLFAKRP